jgi:hypothetical protein
VPFRFRDEVADKRPSADDPIAAIPFCSTMLRPDAARNMGTVLSRTAPTEDWVMAGDVGLTDMPACVVVDLLNRGEVTPLDCLVAFGMLLLGLTWLVG